MTIILDLLSSKYTGFYSPFGDGYSKVSKKTDEIKKILPNIDTLFAEQYVYGVTLLDIKRYAEYGITQETLVFDIATLRAPQFNNRNELAIFLVLHKKIHALKDPSALFFVQKKDNTKHCSWCHKKVTTTNAEHVKSCIADLNARFNKACPSCDLSHTQSYEDDIHSCSQQHYNSHYSSLAVTENKKIAILPSLVVKNVLSFNLVSLTAMAVGTHHYSRAEFANNWKKNIEVNNANVGRQTYDPAISLSAYQDIFCEYGEFTIKCAACDNTDLRLSGVDIHMFMTSSFSEDELKNHRSVCECGAPSFLYTEAFVSLIKRKKTALDSQLELVENTLIKGKDTLVVNTDAKRTGLATTLKAFNVLAACPDHSLEDVTKFRSQMNQIGPLSRVQIDTLTRSVLHKDAVVTIAESKADDDDTSNWRIAIEMCVSLVKARKKQDEEEMDCSASGHADGATTSSDQSSRKKKT